MNFYMFARRFWAFSIDTFLSLVIANGFAYLLLKDQEVSSLTIFLFYFFIVTTYFALQEYSSAQATIGKRLLGLKVCSKDFSEVGIFKAYLRNFVRLINYPILGIGYLPILFNKTGIHDFISKTTVMDKEELEQIKEELFLENNDEV